MNILVETKVLPKATFEKENPILHTGLIAINEEGVQLDTTTGEIISGAKIGDGTTPWEELDYIPATVEIIEKWLAMIKGTTHSRLVTLPDMNFAYSTIIADNNAMIEETVRKIINNGNYFKVVELPNQESPETGILNLTAMGALDIEFRTSENLRQYKISKLSYTKNDEEQLNREYIIYDDESHRLISQLSSILDDTKEDVDELYTSIFDAENGLVKQINDHLIPFTIANSGLVPKPTESQAFGEYYLKADGSWSQIALQGDKIPLSTSNPQTITEVISDLQQRRGFQVQQEGFVERAYVVGISDAEDSTFKFHRAVYIDGEQGVLMGAAWNDYAECRITEAIEPGRVVVENGDDTLSISTERLQLGGNIVSDTYGMLIGETDKARTPIAVCGRVLAYPYENREEYYPGAPVCTGPNGTVSIMSKDEVLHYPECIIGYVSAIPTYEIWNNKNVNGRVWIKVS